MEDFVLSEVFSVAVGSFQSEEENLTSRIKEFNRIIEVLGSSELTAEEEWESDFSVINRLFGWAFRQALNKITAKDHKLVKFLVEDSNRGNARHAHRRMRGVF